ncbi:MAG TPA: TetR/AcrR family transcriptional regulator [Syntrophomonadaceae bacterium]|nr:TetR/AcrR family transcriptional regulator [Syntrophomonadaceae bacterium]HQD91521.1 TetR/AcrR family transcriptional regulator [Syntrophomonadaceae bacterium]
MTTGKSGTTKKGQQTREKIFQAALGLIKERGYEQTTLVDICKAAGIASGTFYHHFASKQDILIEYVKEESRDLMNYYESLPKESYAEAFLQVMDYQALYFERKGTEFVSTFYSIMLLSRNSVYNYGEFSLLSIIYDCCDKGQKQGEFTQQFSPGYMVELAIGLLYTITTYWCIYPSEAGLRQDIRWRMENLLEMLRPTR